MDVKKYPSRRNLRDFDSSEMLKFKNQERRKSGISVCGDFCVKGEVVIRPGICVAIRPESCVICLITTSPCRRCPIFVFLNFFKYFRWERSLKFCLERFPDVPFHILNKKGGVRKFREISYFHAPKYDCFRKHM